MVSVNLHSDDDYVRKQMYRCVEKCVVDDIPIGKLKGKLFVFEDGLEVYVCRTSRKHFSAWEQKPINAQA